MGQSDENWEQDRSEVEYVRAKQSQEAILVDASEWEDVLVVDLRIVHVSQVDLLLLRKEHIGRDQLVCFLVLEDDLWCLLNILRHGRMLTMETDDSVGEQNQDDHKEDDHEMGKDKSYLRESVVDFIVSKL